MPRDALRKALDFGTSAGRNVLDSLLGWAKRESADYTIPVVTSGAIDPDQRITHISTTGAQAYSLADGTYIGQTVYLRVTVTNAVGTLTPATRRGYATIILDAVGEQVQLEWTATGWAVTMFVGTTFS